MSSKAGEISSIIKEQIKQYETKIEMKENGTVITVGDGIATVYGLRSCMANELLRFEDGSFGVAQNLEEETVSVAILSDKDNIQGTRWALPSTARARWKPARSVLWKRSHWASFSVRASAFRCRPVSRPSTV